MRLAQYTVGSLPWFASVGFARSAAGARAPIALVVSRFSRKVLQSSVEILRFRTFRHIRIKSDASRQNNISQSMGVLAPTTTSQVCDCASGQKK